MAGFIKVVEDFTCGHCGEKVKGAGYTNHCPQCLWSRHVDLEVPGDRGNPCQGMMEPIAIEMAHGKYVIIHRCQQCGQKIRNKADKEDNFEEILNI